MGLDHHGGVLHHRAQAFAAAAVGLAEDEEDDEQDSEHNRDDDGDLDPVNGRLPLHLAGLAVDHEVIEFGVVAIVGEEDRQEHVLVRGLRQLRADVQVAVRVAGDLPVALVALFPANDLLPLRPRVGERDAVGLRRPAGEVVRLVRKQSGRLERINLLQHGLVAGGRAGDEHVVVVVRVVAGGRIPAHLAHLPRFGDAPAVLGRRVALGLVIVVAGLRRPARFGVGVERPEGEVDALNLRPAGFLDHVARAEEAFAEPFLVVLIGLIARELERDDRLGLDEVGVGLLLQHLRGAAERAGGGDDGGVNLRGGPAGAALYRLHLAPVAARLARVRERGGEVVLRDGGLRGGDGLGVAALRTLEAACRGIVVHARRAALRAFEGLGLVGDGLGGHEGNCSEVKRESKWEMANEK